MAEPITIRVRVVEWSKRTLPPGAVGVGAETLLCGASAFEVPGNFMDVSFELHFQEGILVTGTNKQKIIIIGIDSCAEPHSLILLSIVAIVIANDMKLDHTLHSFSIWQYWSLGMYRNRVFFTLLLCPSLFLQPPPLYSLVNLCMWSLLVYERCCLEMVPLLYKAPYFSSRGVSLPPTAHCQMPHDMLIFIILSSLSLELLWKIPMLISPGVLSSI